MGDISTWNPVDNSNTAAPPDGWPEGQPASSVNNCARAMMGAVRRWYDTVTAQLASLTTADNLRVLKAGDTMTGTLNAPLLHSTGNIQADAALTAGTVSATGFVATAQYNIGAGIFANNAGGANVLYDSASQQAIALGASDTYYNADNHFFRTNAGVNTATINAAGNLGVQSIGCTGTVTAAQLTSTGNINAAGTVTGTSFIGNVSVPANGPISTGGTVTGGQVTSTGNASVAGTMTAGSVSASSDVTAAGSVTGGSMHCTGTMQTDGQSNLSGPVVMGPGGAWARIDSSGSYNVSGSWQIISGRAGKENIVDYDARGLAAVLALRPVAFNYRADLFGPEEAERTRYGLVADEVAPVVPEMVGETVFGDRNLSTLNMGHLNIVLVRACQDLAAQNAALAARITALEGIQ